MTFKYRYVDFGTVFHFRPGNRPSEDAGSTPSVLHDNELALDVGSICWGCDGEPLPVIDHHFHRPGQFPSASAAVLHKAQLIEEKFHHHSSDVTWLVTHKQPDFDAFCSMYLARSIVEHNIAANWTEMGLDPEAWRDIRDLSSEDGPDGTAPVIRRKIDWFDPDLHGVPTQLRWPLLLASYASHIDNSRRIACPKHLALHSVLYAAIRRGRDFFNDTSGATEFFDEVRETVERKGLNPLFDSVLEGSSRFEPELAMLDHEVEAYRRDVQRSRKAIVHLQKSDLPFKDSFPSVQKEPLLEEDLTTRRRHLAPPNQSRSQADGIYLKDPECLLFKEWARMDTDNSSMGAGFTFTAVAYSGGRPDGRINKTDYFFAVDPEKADRRHLYTLWARLQTAEVRSLHKPEHASLKAQLDEAEQRAEHTSKRTVCRQGFEERAGAYKALFNDPWFDGSNYDCTIVATPNRGSLIGEPGARSDLLDDPIATMVRHELEYSIYASETSTEPAKITVVDLSASRDREDGEAHGYDIVEAAKTLPAPPEGCFRFGTVELNAGVNILSGRIAGQIGESLWQVLNPDLGEGLPADFLTRHLLVSRDWLGIWSRRGIIIAFKPAGEARAKSLEDRFRGLVGLARRVESFIERGSTPIHETSEDLTRAVAHIKHELALPESRLLSRFFEALRLDELLGTLRDLNIARHTATIAEVQTKVEWLEIFIVGFYATELTKIILEHLEGIESQLALFLILAAGLLSMVATLLILKPWKHSRSHGR